MDKDFLKETIKDTAVNILESATFVFVDEDEMNVADCKEFELISGVINFSGHKNGKVMLYVAKEIANSIAANMLGIDDDSEIEDKKREDAVLELVNMITGNLLTNIFGDDVVFELNAPQLLMDDDLSEISEDSSIIISSEAKPLAVSIIFLE